MRVTALLGAAPGIASHARRSSGSIRWVAAAQAKTQEDPALPEAKLLKVRDKGKHLDRPWDLTYLRNRGKVTRAQKEAWRTLWPQYGIDVQTHAGGGEPPPRIDFRTVFPDRPEAPLALEVGFGLGHSLMEMAAANPDKNFVGVEVHKPGIGAALQKIQARREDLGDEWIDNVRVVRMDALWLIRDFLPRESLSDVCVYFPDPWSDAQAHRRIVNPFLLALIEPCMVRHGGRLHLSTDDDAYATHVAKVMAEAESNWTVANEALLGRSGSTKYETRGRALGSEIRNFCYRYVGASLE